MRRLPLLLCSLLFTFATAFATDQLRNVQTELKEQGFFYGEADGKPSAELNAAIRRYQIRNGLEVSGELNNSTLKALGLTDGSEEPELKDPKQPPAQTQKPIQSRPPAPAKPPVDLRRDDSVKESDRRALEEERQRTTRPPDRSVIRPPAPLNAPTDPQPGEEYVEMFAGTPYATAPRVVQEQTVRRAQTLLASKGFYRDDVDGDSGPATEEAILTFQRRSRLPLTGRLDLQTLSVLGLLPGRGSGNPKVMPFNAAPDRGNPRQQVYRGVWVQ